MRPLAACVGMLMALSAGVPAAAHGPTVRLSRDRVAPAQIAVPAGQVVHFHNASPTARSFTVRADDGSFESPPLARGEGWHHGFETPGSYPFFVVEKPDLRGEVRVAPEP